MAAGTGLGSKGIGRRGLELWDIRFEDLNLIMAIE